MYAIIYRWPVLLAAFAEDGATISFIATTLKTRFLKQFHRVPEM